jgi:hypothetical protein
MSAPAASESSSSAPVPSAAVLDTMIRVIMSQTEMTEEKIKTELERTNYDLKRVIREYMLGDTVDSKVTSENKSVSTNQMRFSEIRNFMDKSCEDYYRRQEMTKIYNQVLEKRKAAAEAAAAAAAAADGEATSKL